MLTKWEFLFLGGVSRRFWKIINIFTWMRPNGLGVGAIDRSDLSEHVFDPYFILEVLGKFFMDEVWVICPQNSLKMTFFAFYKGFMDKSLVKSQKWLFWIEFWGRMIQTTSMKLFLRTSNIEYGSKTSSDRSDLSIASTPKPFGRIHVKILMIVQNLLETLPLKKEIPIWRIVKYIGW